MPAGRSPRCSRPLGIDPHRPSPRLRRAHLRRLAEARRARAVRPRHRRARLVMPSQFMADWVQCHFGERLALAWKTVLPIVATCGSRSPRARSPSPLLILEESRQRRPVGRARSLGAQLRPALPVRDLRRRQGQRGRLHRRQGRWRPPRRWASIRCSSMAAPAAARPTCCTPSARFLAAASAPRGVDVGREVHGRVHPRAEGE